MCPEHTIEVCAVHVHHGHQHVDRCDPSGAPAAGDLDGVLGDPRDHVAIIQGTSSFMIIVLAVHLERSLAYAERLQRHSHLAIQAQDPQPPLGLCFGRARERHRRGCDTKHHFRVRSECWLSVHCDTLRAARGA